MTQTACARANAGKTRLRWVTPRLTSQEREAGAPVSGAAMSEHAPDYTLGGMPALGQCRRVGCSAHGWSRPASRNRPFCSSEPVSGLVSGLEVRDETAGESLAGSRRAPALPTCRAPDAALLGAHCREAQCR